MDQKSQGRLLRAWRAYVGDRRGKKLSQQEVADAIQEACIKQGIDPKVRGLPRTRESLARWELGSHRQSMEGLGIIAEVYGVGVMDLMKSPPTAPAPKLQPPPAGYDEIRAIDDALAVLKHKLQKA